MYKNWTIVLNIISLSVYSLSQFDLFISCQEPQPGGSGCSLSKKRSVHNFEEMDDDEDEEDLDEDMEGMMDDGEEEDSDLDETDEEYEEWWDILCIGSHCVYYQQDEHKNTSFSHILHMRKNIWVYPIYQPLRSGRIWHKVNF